MINKLPEDSVFFNAIIQPANIRKNIKIYDDFIFILVFHIERKYLNLFVMPLIFKFTSPHSVQLLNRVQPSLWALSKSDCYLLCCGCEFENVLYSHKIIALLH